MMDRIGTGEKRIPEKVRRRDFTAKVRKVKLCLDDRPYAPVTYTVPGPADVATGDYEPTWVADRDYYIARIVATIGKHDSGTHPADGTPGGQALRMNVRRITADLSDDSPILTGDDVIEIAANSHRDGALNTRDEFAIEELAEGEHMYLRVSQVGSSRAGRALQVTVTLVPKRS